MRKTKINVQFYLNLILKVSQPTFPSARVLCSNVPYMFIQMDFQKDLGTEFKHKAFQSMQFFG